MKLNLVLNRYNKTFLNTSIYFYVFQVLYLCTHCISYVWLFIFIAICVWVIMIISNLLIFFIATSIFFEEKQNVEPVIELSKCLISNWAMNYGF